MIEIRCVLEHGILDLSHLLDVDIVCLRVVRCFGHGGRRLPVHWPFHPKSLYMDGEIRHFDRFAIESMVRDACMSCGGVYLIICLLSHVLLGADRPTLTLCPQVWANIYAESCGFLRCPFFPKANETKPICSLASHTCASLHASSSLGQRERLVNPASRDYPTDKSVASGNSDPSQMSFLTSLHGFVNNELRQQTTKIIYTSCRCIEWLV